MSTIDNNILKWIKREYDSAVNVKGMAQPIINLAAQSKFVEDTVVRYVNRNYRDGLAKKVFEERGSLGLVGNTVDGEIDAYRHLYVPAIKAYEIGAGPARLILDNNEIFNNEKNPMGAASINMDHWNNYLGIMLGVAAKIVRHTTLKDLPDKTAEALIEAWIKYRAIEMIYDNTAIRNALPWPRSPHHVVDYDRLYHFINPYTLPENLNKNPSDINMRALHSKPREIFVQFPSEESFIKSVKTNITLMNSYYENYLHYQQQIAALENNHLTVEEHTKKGLPVPPIPPNNDSSIDMYNFSQEPRLPLSQPELLKWAAPYHEQYKQRNKNILRWNHSKHTDNSNSVNIEF